MLRKRVQSRLINGGTLLAKHHVRAGQLPLTYRRIGAARPAAPLPQHPPKYALVREVRQHGCGLAGDSRDAVRADVCALERRQLVSPLLGIPHGPIFDDGLERVVELILTTHFGENLSQ